VNPLIRHSQTADGVRIAYYRMGTGRPFVSTSELQWGHLGATMGFQERARSANGGGLGRGLSIVRYDARGTGLSDLETIDFSLEAQARDLEAVVCAEGLKRFVLYGRTHGAPLAIHYAAHNPDRVTHLILTTPYARGRDLRPPAEAMGLEPRADMTQDQWAAFTAAIAAQTLDFQRPDITNALAAQYRRSMTPAAYLALLRWRESIDVTALLPQIRVPTLVLSRRTSRRPALEIEVARLIPGSVLVANDAGTPAGRWLPAETAAVEEFLGIDENDVIVSAGAVPRDVNLTAREIEVLKLVVAGRSNREIADVLVVSARTAARHVANIYEKTGTHNRAEVTAFSLRNGLA
jgi:pimeloyl-ACP methyl ester carboxylesterase/DNA-binding CsgD family transcriptional regulator